MILHLPVGASQNRCGDRIRFRRGRIVRNGKLEIRKTIRKCRHSAACGFPRTITVPDGHVYVAGDNRDSSDDSRFWGAVPVAQVLGRYVRIAGTCGCSLTAGAARPDRLTT